LKKKKRPGEVKSKRSSEDDPVGREQGAQKKKSAKCRDTAMRTNLASPTSMGALRCGKKKGNSAKRKLCRH